MERGTEYGRPAEYITLMQNRFDQVDQLIRQYAHFVARWLLKAADATSQLVHIG